MKMSKLDQLLQEVQREIVRKNTWTLKQEQISISGYPEETVEKFV